MGGVYNQLLFGDNRMTDSSIVPLLDELTNHCPHSIFTLDLSDNTIGPRSVTVLPLFLQSQRNSLLVLNLSGCLSKVNNSFTTQLLQSIANSKHRKNNNNSDDVNLHLHTLILSNNSLNNQHALVLADMLTHNQLPALNLLDVQWNTITSQGVSAIALSMSTNTTLTTLNLNYNTSSHAAEEFAVPLLTNQTLKNLHLVANNIDGTGALVLAEYLLETEHPLDLLNLNANPITQVGAKAMLQIIARGVSITNLYFESEYSNNPTLTKLFDPMHLTKKLHLDLTIPFQRAQATMLLRMASEHAGFTLLKVSHGESSSSSSDELDLVRLTLDLESVSIKEYKRIFMSLCRQNNPSVYFTSIEKAFIPTSQARELLTIAHRGREPCDLMYNMIISAFDVNDDGIIEWSEFFEGMQSARNMFGPTIRRMGQEPVGVMVERGRTTKYSIPTVGMLSLEYTIIPVPLLQHNETTRCNFNKINVVLNEAPPHNRLQVSHLKYLLFICFVHCTTTKAFVFSVDFPVLFSHFVVFQTSIDTVQNVGKAPGFFVVGFDPESFSRSCVGDYKFNKQKKKHYPTVEFKYKSSIEEAHARALPCSVGNVHGCLLD